MQTKNEYLNKLRQFKQQYSEEYGIERIGIFGSVARGEQTLNSDVDVLVEFGRPVGIEFIDMSYLLEKEFNRKVDVVSRRGVKDKYLKEIEKDIVYA